MNTAYFYAMSQTKLRSNLGIIGMTLSIPVTYFVLAPSSAAVPGMDLGSVGLALKMVVLHIIGVNIATYFICKLPGWRFDFLYQVMDIAILLTGSFAIKGVLDLVFHGIIYADLYFNDSGDYI